MLRRRIDLVQPYRPKRGAYTVRACVTTNIDRPFCHRALLVACRTGIRLCCTTRSSPFFPARWTGRTCVQSRVNRGLTWLPTKLGTMKEMTTGTGVFWISVKTIWTIFQADDIHFFLNIHSSFNSYLL